MGESSLIEDIKSQLSVPDVAGVGSGHYTECPDPACPGHAKGKVRCRIKASRWLCFYCGAYGDIFNWVMLTRDCDFKVAFHELAAQAGICLRLNDDRSRALRKVVAAGSRYLMEHSELREYLEHERGIPKGLIFRHQLGYIDPEGEVFDAAGVSELELLQLGFLDKPWPGDTNYRSFMVNRYLLPIRNKWGDIVHVRGRINPHSNPGPKCPKTLSLPTRTPYTPSDWGSISTSDYFYLEDNLERARQQGYLIVCEGELDAHTAESLGHPAIGVQGTGGFERQFHKLKGIARVYDARDNDLATERRMPKQLLELQLSLPGQIVYRLRLPYLAGVDEDGDPVKVDVNDYVVKFRKTRQDFKALMVAAPTVYRLLTETYAPEYQKDESFMKLKRLYHTASTEIKDRMLKRMVTITGVPEDKLAFALDPSLGRSHA